MATAVAIPKEPVLTFRPVIPVREASRALLHYTAVRTPATRNDLRVSVGQLGVDQAVNVLVGERVA